MTTIEHKELKGITLRNLIVTIASTASIVASVVTTYFGLKDDIREVSQRQETQARVYDIRLKVLEDEVNILQQQMNGLKSNNPAQRPVSFAATKLIK